MKKHVSIDPSIRKILDSLDSYLNNAMDGIVIVDLEGNVMEINEACEKLHGWRKEELFGRNFPMTPAFLLDEAKGLLKHVLNGGVVSGLETYKLRKDGSMFHASVSVSPIKDEQGNTVALIGVERDITERKMAESQLQESEERYRQLVELMPEAVIVYTDYRIAYVNPAAVRLLCAESKEQLLGTSAYEFLLSEDSSVLQMEIEHLMQYGMTSSNIVEKKIMRLDKEVIDAEVRAAAIIFHGKPSFQLLCRDITYRKKTEETLRERDQMYKRMLEVLPEPIVVLEDEKVVYINEMGVKLFGAVTADEVIGKSIFNFIHKDHRAVTKRRMQSAIQIDGRLDFVENKLVRLDGKEIDVESSAIFLPKFTGKPAIQAVFRDLTERKNTEEMVRRSEKLSIVGQLAAGIAHEIRNPLTALMGFTQLLRKSQDAKVAEYTDIMLAELSRINYIVSEFMLIAKPQTSKFENRDIPEIIENVVSLLQPQAILHNAVISLHAEDNLPNVECDGNQIKQVFINVLKNAIEALPMGGHIDIEVRHTRSSKKMQIRISDNGLGIPEERIPRLGTPFFTTKEHGTGLGLMVCYRIIEAHKGTMTITSQENKGTSIEISLPLA